MPNTELIPEVGQAVVAAARSWVGTPYRHRGRLKGIAVDCVGLILGVASELELVNIDPEDWKRFSTYARTPNPARMGEAMETFLHRLDIPPEEAAPDGSIAWMGWREGLPMHLAIMATFEGRRTMVHAYEHVERCAEHGFAAEWPGRVVSWWAYPGALAGSPSDDLSAGNPD